VVALLAQGASAEAFEVAMPYMPDRVPEAPRLVIGSPGGLFDMGAVAVAVRTDALGLTAHVTLHVTALDVVPRESVIAVELPHGARVTGAAITIGKTERMVAAASSVERAKVEYQRVLDVGKDPVLVHWKTGDEIEVRAFPLSAGHPGTIELTIELPAISALAIDVTTPKLEYAAGAKRTTYRKVSEPITVELPRQRELALPLVAARPGVGPTMSLFAGFAPSMGMPIILTGRPTHVAPELRGNDVRKEVKRHLAKLGHCYEHEVQFRGGPEGTAVLHFLISKEGKVESTTIDGAIENEAITSCLANVVATSFEFRAGDSAIQVNYPLTFRLSSY
jgi:hypothetical protein